MNYGPYWIVERKLKSGGTVLVGLSNGGPIYTQHGYEMRLSNSGSADAFRSYAEQRLSVLEGQEGKLFITLVKPHT